MESGYRNDGRTDHRDEEGAIQIVDPSAKDTRQLGSHCKPNRDVQVGDCTRSSKRTNLMCCSFTGINPEQSKTLTETAHIYLTVNGRISMAGLNSHNITYFAESLDRVVRGST